MKAKVNIQLLKTTSFDSGALGMLAMVIHQFTEAGHYRAAVMQKGRPVTDIDFDVDEKSTAMQLDIDLAEAVRKSKARPDDCGCESEKVTAWVVSPKGYVLFHASSGEGYSASVSDQGGKVVFDSTRLGEGDLFALSLLEPANYSMKNQMGSAAGEIIVDLTPEAAREIHTLETRYVDVSRMGFSPGRFKLTSSQGLVFRVKDSARIMIEKREGRQQEREKPAIGWRKFQSRNL